MKAGDKIRLIEILSCTPLRKPVDHKGDRNTDMFIVDLDKNTTARVLKSLTHHLHFAALRDQRRKRLLVAIERSWHEYSDYQASKCKVVSE